MNQQTERDKFFYCAGRLSAKRDVNYAFDDWRWLWLQANHLHGLYEKLCRGEVFVPAYFATGYTGDGMEFAYLEYLEGKLATLIRQQLLPGARVCFNRDPRGHTVQIDDGTGNSLYI